MDLTPQTLKGSFVMLESITENHREGLRAAATADDTIYDHMPMDIAGDYDDWFDQSLEAGPAAGQLVFIVRNNADGTLVGSSRYLNISAREPRLEIGYTWYTPAAQGTAVNPEAKLLLMTHAFEEMKCVRVELKADARNARSRRAMEKMGAKYEGTLRRHMKVREGFIRDTVYYSVLDSEWPDVKRGLQRRVAAFGEAAQ